MWPSTPGSITYKRMDDHEESPAEIRLDLRVGDVRWAAELIDIYRAGDIESSVELLDEMLGRLRSAAKARRILATVEPVLLREALGLAAPRGSAER